MHGHSIIDKIVPRSERRVTLLNRRILLLEGSHADERMLSLMDVSRAVRVSSNGKSQEDVPIVRMTDTRSFSRNYSHCWAMLPV